VPATVIAPAQPGELFECRRHNGPRISARIIEQVGQQRGIHDLSCPSLPLGSAQRIELSLLHDEPTNDDRLVRDITQARQHHERVGVGPIVDANNIGGDKFGTEALTINRRPELAGAATDRLGPHPSAQQ
jgi:hypothetical protein